MPIREDALRHDKAVALRLIPVSRETEAKLEAYLTLLQQWQAKTNLIAPSTLPELWTRHVADSLQLLSVAPQARKWLDIGSGGGFPGIVLACAMADVAGGHVTLVERIAKKAAFLREALRVTQAPGTVFLGDIGDSVDSLPGPLDCVTARAVAPLHQLIGYAEPLMTPGVTKALFLKGQDVDVELTEATKYWNVQPRLYPSLTGNGWIVEVDRIERRTEPSPEKNPP